MEMVSIGLQIYLFLEQTDFVRNEREAIEKTIPEHHLLTN
jgi:hypothetical protein